LRGLNVGSRKKVKMAEKRRSNHRHKL